MFCVELLTIRLASLVVIGLVYMVFDIFNKRNIPLWFAYPALAYAALLTVLYFNVNLIGISAAIAAVVLALGYVVYRLGFLGGADVIELATLSLILPFQKIPLLNSVNQIGMPFIISLFIASGVSALILVPLYYLPKAKVGRMRIGREIPRSAVIKSISIGVIYAVFYMFLAFEIGVSVSGAIVLLAMVLGSIAIILFENPLTKCMIRTVDVSAIEEGDLIAMNMISQKDIEMLGKRIGSFGRLATSDLIKEMKRKKIRIKLPVYKKAVPLAAPIFIGIVISILFGNIILFLLIP
ncbi:hypothetical protein M1397_00155 [Candidatus Marsarchaeota archaeon]|jgi:Flp pilus assembly protein protease CpaA|nr:hypothetical protein [Candidatus Marsarchaeota archaeon]